MLPALRRERGLGLMEEPDWFRRELGRVFSGWPWDARDPTAGGYPVDIREDENKMYIDAEMPGFRKEEIDVTLQNGILTLSAERKPEDFKGRRHLEERCCLRIQRSFTLPTAVDESQVSARFEDGVLHLEMPKSENAKPQKITIT
jgi:HSP20 family protein